MRNTTLFLLVAQSSERCQNYLKMLVPYNGFESDRILLFGALNSGLCLLLIRNIMTSPFHYTQTLEVGS